MVFLIWNIKLYRIIDFSVGLVCWSSLYWKNRFLLNVFPWEVEILILPLHGCYSCLLLGLLIILN